MTGCREVGVGVMGVSGQTRGPLGVEEKQLHNGVNGCACRGSEKRYCVHGLC